MKKFILGFIYALIVIICIAMIGNYTFPCPNEQPEESQEITPSEEIVEIEAVEVEHGLDVGPGEQPSIGAYTVSSP